MPTIDRCFQTDFGDTYQFNAVARNDTDVGADVEVIWRVAGVQVGSQTKRVAAGMTGEFSIAKGKATIAEMTGQEGELSVEAEARLA